MKAAVVNGPGASPEYGDFAEPDTRPGYELGELVGAGLHQTVRSRVAGTHYSSAKVWPAVPGVDAVVRGADGGLRYGGRPRAPWGTMAERMALPVGLDLPADADPLAVAAGVNPAMSGWIPLARRRAEAGMLGTVLVLGATGAAGGLAVRAALHMGADHVVAAGRNRAVLETLELPHVSTLPLPADADTLRAAVAEHRPTTVLDYVWGSTAEAVFAALLGDGGDDGTEIDYVEVGATGGTDAALPAALLRSRHISLRGSGSGSMSDEELIAQLPGIITAIADGSLPVPYRAFPLGDIAEAWSWQGPGRAVLVP